MPGRGAPTARRYAQALFQLALEHSQTDRWRQDLQTLSDATQNGQTKTLLEMPSLRPADRLNVIRKALLGVSPLAANLLALLAQRGTVGLLPRIMESFLKMADEHQGLVRASVTTAVPLDQTEHHRITEQLKELFGKTVVVQTHVDPGILGGLIVRAGDQVIDGSSRGKLETLRKTLRERAAI